MNKFIATFCMSSELAHFCQPIAAKNKEEAEQKMFEAYGKKWAFVYTPEELDGFEYEELPLLQ